MSDFTEYIDLASERLGGAVLWANDEFFAPKENLLKVAEPRFEEHRYTDRGKWMDGWETRRRRRPGHDRCVVRLGHPGLIRGVVVDTAYFRGNYPEACSIEGCALEGEHRPETLAGDEVDWVEILSKSALEGDSKNRFEIDVERRFTHLRLHIYPDGGVARLRVHGEPLPDLARWDRRGEVDLAAIENGGRVIAASDMFFGSANNLLMPGRARNMGEGWETKRRRGPGHDWVVIELGAEGRADLLEVDTEHFKGNYPDRFALEGCRASGEGFEAESVDWSSLVGETSLQAHTRHQFDIESVRPLTHLRLNIYPDGGVARLRLYGRPTEGGLLERRLQWLNTLPEAAARRALLTCCGSTRWAEQMADHRAFSSLDEVKETADDVWHGLDRNDWLEAFSAHPKIGERKAEKEESDTSQKWSEQEQSGTAEASQKTLDELYELNVAYEERFGFIFIVCATGKSAEEMLALLKDRIDNDPEDEVEIAAEEQRKITRLRLDKLLTNGTT